MLAAGNRLLDSEPRGDVLIVDDEPCIQLLMTQWLSGEGYRCATADDAEDAWNRLQENDTHLVTLDITMPGRSGIELLEDIQRSFPDTAVIMVTALSDTDSAVHALTLGALDYLVKPVERQDLVNKAEMALEKRQFNLEKRRYTQNLEEEVRRQMAATRRAHEETIHRLLSASAYRDDETGAHIRRVGLIAEALARAAGWSAEKSEMIRMAAPMHDVGKIGIPDAILRKPGKLTDDEYRIMQSHAVIGANLLAGSESVMLQMAHDIALCHHENWDGSGYPDGKAGSAIPACARIATIADVYDALTHDRVYRPAFPDEEALRMLQQGGGTQFDPTLLSAFFEALPTIEQINRENPEEPAEEDQ